MNHAKTILPALLGLLVLFWTGDKIGYRIRADMEAGVSWLDMADRFCAGPSTYCSARLSRRPEAGLVREAGQRDLRQAVHARAVRQG